jgi:hypothetical protein
MRPAGNVEGGQAVRCHHPLTLRVTA